MPEGGSEGIIVPNMGSASPNTIRHISDSPIVLGIKGYREDS